MKSVILTTCLFALMASASTSATHAEWSTIGGNAAHTSYVQGMVDIENRNILWSSGAPVDGRVNGIAIGGGAILFTANGGDYDAGALDIATGETLWQIERTELEGLMNPPAFGNGNMYIYGWYDLLAKNPLTGETLFSTELPRQRAFGGTPTHFGDSIYFDGGTFSELTSYNANTGAFNWLEGVPLSSIAGSRPGWTAAVDDDYVYYHTTTAQSNIPSWLVVNDRYTGELRGAVVDYDATSSFGTVVLGENNLAYVAYGDKLTAWDVSIDPESSAIENTLEVAWSIEGVRGARPALADGKLYIPSSDIDGTGAEGLLVLDAQTGEELWVWEDATDYIPTAMIVTDNVLFVRSQIGIGTSPDRLMQAVDLSTRQTIWSIEGTSQMALDDGVLYVDGIVDGVAGLHAISIAVPEPTSLVLLVAGGGCLFALRLVRKFRVKKSMAGNRHVHIVTSEN